METLSLFFTEFVLAGSFLLFWFVTFIFIGALLVSEEESSWRTCVIISIIAVIIYWKFTNVPLGTIFTPMNVFLYLAIGFSFALLRTYIYGKNSKGSRIGKSSLEEKIAIWWFFFPISLISWTFSELIFSAYKAIYSKVSALFDRIYSMGNNE
jgi:hypothetical protein